MTTRTEAGIDVAAMLCAGAAAVRARTDDLTTLDSAVGDGDHGITMARAADRLTAALADTGLAPPDAFKAAGKVMLTLDGGAIGPLLGSFFNGTAAALDGVTTATAPALATAFKAGLDKLLRLTPARPGDKTLLDALVPAVGALAAHAEAGSAEALAAAARAAADGAASTRALAGRYGRCKHIADKGVGHQDPGATSVAFLFEGFARLAAGEPEP